MYCRSLEVLSRTTNTNKSVCQGFKWVYKDTHLDVTTLMSSVHKTTLWCNMVLLYQLYEDFYSDKFILSGFSFSFHFIICRVDSRNYFSSLGVKWVFRTSCAEMINCWLNLEVFDETILFDWSFHIIFPWPCFFFVNALNSHGHYVYKERKLVLTSTAWGQRRHLLWQELV